MRFKVWYRKYGAKKADGSYSIPHQIFKGTYEVPDDVDETEKYLEDFLGKPPSGFTMDFSATIDE